mmetsp:Transcript_7163/g.11334  ORF Transcript_7163/g.11334 Transcript_7163/m.11334 type:complete len:264 (-) Transcript_7163:1196-1987(-)
MSPYLCSSRWIRKASLNLAKKAFTLMQNFPSFTVSSCLEVRDLQQRQPLLDLWRCSHPFSIVGVPTTTKFRVDKVASKLRILVSYCLPFVSANLENASSLIILTAAIALVCGDAPTGRISSQRPSLAKNPPFLASSVALAPSRSQALNRFFLVSLYFSMCVTFCKFLDWRASSTSERAERLFHSSPSAGSNRHKSGCEQKQQVQMQNGTLYSKATIIAISERPPQQCNPTSKSKFPIKVFAFFRTSSSFDIKSEASHNTLFAK